MSWGEIWAQPPAKWELLSRHLSGHFSLVLVGSEPIDVCECPESYTSTTTPCGAQALARFIRCHGGPIRLCWRPLIQPVS